MYGKIMLNIIIRKSVLYAVAIIFHLVQFTLKNYYKREFIYIYMYKLGRNLL